MSARSWPSSPLASAAVPSPCSSSLPPTSDSTAAGFDDLPDEILPLERLRALLLAPQTSVEVRDTVWRELVIRARRDGPAWVVAPTYHSASQMPGVDVVPIRVATGPT